MGRLFLAVLTLATACSDPVGVEEATLTIGVHQGGRVRWPHGSGERLELVNSLDEQRGMAGFEIDIADTTFTATDFRFLPPRFVVPDTGHMTFVMRLMQDGELVSDGSESWELHPGAEWKLYVNRAPYAPTEGYSSPSDIEHPQCSWFGCWKNWRFPILEEVRNYEQEAVWITLYRVDVCTDICPES